MMSMKNAQLTIADFCLNDEELESIFDILRSGRLSEGSKVHEFEEAWSSVVESRYCVAFSSGSTALLGSLLAARDLGLINGKAILTNPSTYVGTVNAISLAGYDVEFVDIESGSFGTLAIDQLRTKLEDDSRGRIAAVLPVHLFGIPERIVDMIELGRAFDRPILEDAAEAHGSKSQGKSLGSWGLFSTFSFYQGHTIPGVEMGAVVTNSQILAESLRCIKDQGRLTGAQRNEENWFTAHSIGLNFKATEINAGIGLIHIKKIAKIAQMRRHNARILSDKLLDWSEVLRLPNFPEEACPFAYPIQIKDELMARPDVRRLLHASGIETRPMFPCIPLDQPAYSGLRTQYLNKLPNAGNLGRSGFYVGCHEHLTTDDVEAIGDSIIRAIKSLLNSRS